jgi:hypothetical protein
LKKGVQTAICCPCGNQRNHSANDPMRDRYGCFPVSKCLRLCIMARALSREKGQWWQGAVHQKSTRAKPGSDCPAHGRTSLHHAKDYLGEFFRRITRRLGRPQAITATAHKLARIVYHLLGTKEAYNESVFHKSEADTIRRAEYRLRRQAAQLGF